MSRSLASLLFPEYRRRVLGLLLLRPDEALHGRGLDRGSELCSAVEMMFSLEKMLEITGEVDFADRLEKIAFNPLPAQTTDDHQRRQGVRERHADQRQQQ
jgi:hypothetical protein